MGILNKLIFILASLVIILIAFGVGYAFAMMLIINKELVNENFALRQAARQDKIIIDELAEKINQVASLCEISMSAIEEEED